ncbi:unnamed protein product [Polarella glacialis]|nr:unnamed protein product [Polarella glacialis]|mmetsp:Transcript_19100/g.30517  ORF Transcript_19100/g.30517 Transcript_19100/m.30517 type:complete len:132 (-) Transcript_19100:93-488(-)
MAPCYTCLASSPLGQCAGPGGGGLSCVMAFTFMAFINSFFLSIKLFMGGPFVLMSFAFQFAGGVQGWRLNSLVSAAAASGDGSFGGQSGQGLLPQQPMAQMNLGAAPGGRSGAPAPPSFSAFQGTGQRLGG